MPACRFCGRDPASVFALTACTFCRRCPAACFALTALSGDPKGTASWRREVLPLCPRCHRRLAVAGAEGQKLKATGERWHLGHGVGRFASELGGGKGVW